MPGLECGDSSDQHSQEYISGDDWWQQTYKDVKSNDLFSL